MDNMGQDRDPTEVPAPTTTLLKKINQNQERYSGTKWLKADVDLHLVQDGPH